VLSGKWLEDSFARGTRAAAADRLEFLLPAPYILTSVHYTRIQGVPAKRAGLLGPRPPSPAVVTRARLAARACLIFRTSCG